MFAWDVNGKTLLGVVNRLLKTKSLLTMPSNVLPLHLKKTFPPIIWIFTEGEGDGIESRLPFKFFSTLCKENSPRVTQDSIIADQNFAILISIETEMCSCSQLFLDYLIFRTLCYAIMLNKGGNAWNSPSSFLKCCLCVWIRGSI